LYYDVTANNLCTQRAGANQWRSWGQAEAPMYSVGGGTPRENMGYGAEPHKLNKCAYLLANVAANFTNLYDYSS